MIMRMNQKGMTQVWMVGLAMAGLMSQSAWAYLPKLGEEFSVLPPMVGDQVNAQLAMGQEGGYLVWEDNSIDGKGKGIAAARLNAEYHLEFSPFAVNQEAEGDQVNPQIATNETGHSLITWEQDGNLFGRILNPDGSFDADAFSLGSHQHEEGNLKIEGFGNQGFVAVWESADQDGHRLGVFGQLIDNNAEPLGDQFAINQNAYLNQRQPDVISLGEQGGFVAAWVSEVPLSGQDDYAVTVWARSYDQTGQPNSPEFEVTDASLMAANPQLAINAQGQISVAFNGLANPALSHTMVGNTWDVYAAPINPMQPGNTSAIRINQPSNGQNVTPQIVGLENSFAVVWAHSNGTMGQADIMGSVLNGQANQVVGETSVLNSNRISAQMMPSLATQNNQTLLATWSSFQGGAESFEIKAQRYHLAASSGLLLPDAATPYTFGLGFDRVGVSWAAIEGFNVAQYEVYLDGSSTPLSTSDNFIEIGDLQAGSLHHVRLAYVTADGVRSALSGESEVRTWTADANHDGLPDAFQTTFWGGNVKNWEAADVDSDQDGLTNLEELMAGTNPLNPRSVLNIGLEKRDSSTWLAWEMQPGGIYGIESTRDLQHWEMTHGPILATEFEGGMPINTDQAKNLYRVLRLK